MDVLRLADRASNFYVDGKISSLSSAVVDAIGDVEYNRDQIARVVAATNQAVWAKLSSRKPPHLVRFDPASVEDVVGTKEADEVGVEKTASTRSGQGTFSKTATSSMIFLETLPVSRLEGILFSDMEKTAAEEQRPFDIIPENTASWDRIAAQVSKAKEALNHELASKEISFGDAVNRLTKTASEMLLEGTTPEEISYVIKHFAPGDVGDALISHLTKEAFAPMDPYCDEFEAFIQKGAKRIDGRSDLWDRDTQLEKTAGQKFQSFMGKLNSTDGLNPEHPIAKIAAELNTLREESLLLSKAASHLAGKEKEARKLAFAGAEVPVHA